MAGSESVGLNLLGAYESSSDSERDSGYTSEEDKKRKNHNTLFKNEHKSKRRRVEEPPMEEDMIVDNPECDKIQPALESNFSSNYQRNYTNYDLNRLSIACNDLAVPNRKNSLIPLPSELAMEGTSYVDNASRHQNRIRSFPHDPGNWAAIFYLPLDEASAAGSGITSYDTLQSLVADAVKLCRIHNVSLTPASDFHISLTKTLHLRLHLLQPLAHHVRTALVSVTRFRVCLNKFEVYVNEEKSRTFLGLRVMSGHNELAGVVRRLDTVLRSYDLPAFYKDCRLHASVAWLVGDQAAQLRQLLPVLEDHFADYFSDDCDQRSFHAKHLHFKAGNRVHSLQLGPYTG